MALSGEEGESLLGSTLRRCAWLQYLGQGLVRRGWERGSITWALRIGNDSPISGLGARIHGPNSHNRWYSSPLNRVRRSIMAKRQNVDSHLHSLGSRVRWHLLGGDSCKACKQKYTYFKDISML